MMLRHFFELILRPCSHGMDVAILIAHELKIRQRNSDRFCADPKETADINDCRTAGTCPMDMVDLSDLMVVRAIYGCTFENSWCQSAGFRRT